MRLYLENYKDTWSDDLKKFSIDWFYYPGAKPEILAKHNGYRARHGMHTVLDDGSYAYFKIYFGKRVLGVELQIRPRRLEEPKV